VLEPLLSEHEHGLSGLDELDTILRAIPEYAELLQNKSASAVRPSSLAADAIAEFLRSIRPELSPVEKYLRGEDRALNALEYSGFLVFNGRGQCGSCHIVNKETGIGSDGRFHSLGVGIDPLTLSEDALKAYALKASGATVTSMVFNPRLTHLGRFLVTLSPDDIGKFRTPSLKSVSRTSPYMHDGSVASLEKAVDLEIYYRSLKLSKPIVLSGDELAALMAFLKAL
jgi:cytochrome c peroxidase